MMLNSLVLLTGAEVSAPAGTAWPEVLPGPQTGAARSHTPHPRNMQACNMLLEPS